MSAKPPVHLVIAALAERDAETAGRVVRRVAGAMAPGAFAELLAVPVALPDAFVRVVAEHGAAEDVVALAGNPHLTARQLAWLIEAGGEVIRRKAFDPDQPLPFSARTLAEMRAEAEASPDDADAPGAAHAGVPGNAADGAWLRIREADCGADEAARLLAAHPEVGYTARVRADPAPGWRSRHADLRPLLHDPDVPRASSAEIAPAVESALALGALDPAALWTRMSPALVAVQVLAKLTREHAAQFARESDVDAMLRPLLARTLGTKPEAWAALAARLARATVPLSELLDEIAGSPDDTAGADGAVGAAPTVITASAKVRPALLFLIRRLDIADVEAVLPHLDGDLVRDLIQGHVPIPAEVIDLAHRSGHPVLLAKAAGHQHLRDTEARRLQAYEDRALDRILALNKSGVSAAVRREILGGVSPSGGPRRPMDPELRQAVIDDPAAAEWSTAVYSGDPALVCEALPKAARLRRIDQLDVVLALWERGGAQAVEGVLTSVPDGLSAVIAKKAEAALAAGTRDTLTAERAKLHARAKPPVPRPRDQWDYPPDERIREFPLEAQDSRNQWLRFVDPEPLLAVANPAAAALAALPRHCADARGPEVFAALDSHAVRHLGTEPEAWAVFVQLLPEFAGTVAELAEVCAAVGTPAAGAEG
ncbi:hypothetical protein GCM10023205_80250 [Yinghuangia aomiensis]|uniref:Leucine rich repeat variant n=1 Tax=Yinghuangia aomiensis TaxID=676205 RepID=A0ABP9ID44_9ACTN